MWRKIIPALLAMCAIATATPEAAFAQRFDRLNLQPTGDWQIEDNGIMCEAVRLFSNGERTLSLRISARNPSPNWTFTIQGGAMMREWDKLDMEVRLFADEYPRYIRAVPYLVDGNIRYTFEFPIRRPTEEPAAYDPATAHNFAVEEALETEFERLEVDPDWRAPVIFNLGSMHPVFADLRNCSDRLMESWGLDSEAQRMRSARAYILNWSEFQPRELWSDHINTRDGATYVMVWMRVLVDAEANPTDCGVQFSSWRLEPAQQACDWLVENGRFRPAVSSDGFAIPSYTILWFGVNI